MTQEWTIQKLLQWTAGHFAAKQIPSARLDAEILLAHTLNCRRLDLYLKFDQPLLENELKNFKELVVRRGKFEPVAYITGKQEFYGRPFSVGPGVLIPRPETEHLIDEALAWAKSPETGAGGGERALRVLDIGAGSGCIAVTLALELPQARVTALEISPAGCRFTALNAETLSAAGRVETVSGDFEKFESPESFDLIVSNPPYVGLKSKPSLQPDVVNFEPHEALFGGDEGHETLAKWMAKIAGHLAPKGLFVCEIGFDQGISALGLTRAAGPDVFSEIKIIKDLSGHDRILRAVKNG